jgi:hypothetical protein
MLRIIEINPSDIPIRRTYTVGDIDYMLEFRYNARFDFITLSIINEDEQVFTTKLTYGNNVLFGNRTIPFAVVPLAEVDLYKEGFLSLIVNKETLGKNVFLYFEDGVN